MTNSASLGEQIKALRNRLGESQEEFGKHFAPPASKGIVSKWENGKSTPSSDRLNIISSLSGKSPEELLYGSLHGAINEVAKYIQNLYPKYFDEFQRPLKEYPKDRTNIKDSKLSYGLDTLSFILSDSYVDSPKAWKSHRGESNPHFSSTELEEIKNYYHTNFLKGLSYCFRDTEQQAKAMQIKPYQTILLFKLFSESAQAHFEEKTKDNTGAINTVAFGLEDIQQSLYSLFHTVDSKNNQVELPNKINPELYDDLDNLLDEFGDQVEKLRDLYPDNDQHFHFLHNHLPASLCDLKEKLK